MKNVLVLLVCICFFSCIKRKDWNCECEVKPNGSSTWDTVKKVITNERLNEANMQCGEFGQKAVRGNGSSTCKVTPV